MNRKAVRRGTHFLTATLYVMLLIAAIATHRSVDPAGSARLPVAALCGIGPALNRLR